MRLLRRPQRDCQALKDRIEEDDSGSDNDDCGGQEHGTEAHRARVHNRFLQGHALLTAQLDEVHEDDGVPDDDASQSRIWQ